MQREADTELLAVYFQEGGSFTVGSNGCDRIVLRADGNGLSGFYDRIHIFGSDEILGPYHRICPAHNVEGFAVKQTAANGGDDAACLKNEAADD